MSQSLLPKNLPDLLRQENLDKTLEVLRQPFSLAILASLGIHALLGVTLPMLPAAKPKEPDPEAVKVVELSPAEQARIPELSNPQVNFPPISSKTKLPDQSSKSSIAKTPPSIFDDSLYNFPALPPAPISIFPDIPIPIRDSPQRTVNRTATPTPTPTPTVKPTSSSTANTTKPDTQPSAPAPTASVASTRPEKIPQAAIVALREQQEKIRREREQSSAGVTTQSEAAKLFQEWLNETAQAENIPVETLSGSLQKPSEIQIRCPAKVCPEKASRTAALILAVNQNGKVIGNPLLTSTGDKDLDQAAKDTIKEVESKLSSTGSPKVYQYRIQFIDSTEQ
jgi:outer membrane biosynthesis protein TonB